MSQSRWSLKNKLKSKLGFHTSDSSSPSPPPLHPPLTCPQQPQQVSSTVQSPGRKKRNKLHLQLNLESISRAASPPPHELASTSHPRPQCEPPCEQQLSANNISPPPVEKKRNKLNLQLNLESLSLADQIDSQPLEVAAAAAQHASSPPVATSPPPVPIATPPTAPPRPSKNKLQLALKLAPAPQPPTPSPPPAPAPPAPAPVPPPASMQAPRFKNKLGLSLTIAAAATSAEQQQSEQSTASVVEKAASCDHQPAPPSPPPPPPSTSDVFRVDEFLMGGIGKFNAHELHVVRELGHGSSGSVSKCWNTRTLRHVACKRIRVEASNEVTQRQVRRELLALNKCGRSRFVVDFYGVFAPRRDEIAICMEYLNGGSLDTILARVQRIGEHVLAKIARCVLDAMKFLHDEHHIMHRDIKPSNILIDTRGAIKLCDLGVSVPLDADSFTSSFIGTRCYMSVSLLLFFFDF